MSTVSLTNFDTFPQNGVMHCFGAYLSKHLEGLGISPYNVALNNAIDYALLNKVINGKRRASDDFLKKLASIESLKLDLPMLQAWRALDDLPPEAIDALTKLRKLEKADPARYARLKKQAMEFEGKEPPKK